MGAIDECRYTLIVLSRDDAFIGWRMLERDSQIFYRRTETSVSDDDVLAAGLEKRQKA